MSVEREQIEWEFRRHPELRGKMFAPKAGGTTISWSWTLLTEAGGYERLMAEWEQVEL